MNGQLDKVTVQRELCLTSPENVYYRRDQSDGGYAQIGEKGLFIAYRRKSQAIKQNTDADRSENR